MWGDALIQTDRLQPDVQDGEPRNSRDDGGRRAWAGKGIHYRMHPANIDFLTAARIDCCTLANNHVLDWGYDGLKETIATLHAAGIRTAGASKAEAAARTPIVVPLTGNRRLLVFAYGTPGSGIPPAWAAQPGRRAWSNLTNPNRGM